MPVDADESPMKSVSAMPVNPSSPLANANPDPTNGRLVATVGAEDFASATM